MCIRDRAVEDGSYPKLVERNLPVWHRTGTVLRRDLWKVFPEWKEKFFQNISRQEVDEFLASAAGYPLEANRRFPSMTANDFYHACALGYRAMGYAGTEKPDKEQYLLHADGRDEGLSLIHIFPRSQSDTGKRRSFFRLLIGRMDTGGSLKVIRRFEPGPARVDGYKAFEQAAVNHPQLREDRAMSILGVVQKVLNGNEIISGNNALVVIPVKALGAVAPILPGLVVQVVRGEGLSGQHIPCLLYTSRCV